MVQPRRWASMMRQSSYSALRVIFRCDGFSVRPIQKSRASGVQTFARPAVALRCSIPAMPRLSYLASQR
jgi:hypothetical protein